MTRLLTNGIKWIYLALRGAKKHLNFLYTLLQSANMVGHVGTMPADDRGVYASYFCAGAVTSHGALDISVSVKIWEYMMRRWCTYAMWRQLTFCPVLGFGTRSHYLARSHMGIDTKIMADFNAYD